MDNPYRHQQDADDDYEPLECVPCGWVQSDDDPAFETGTAYSHQWGCPRCYTVLGQTTWEPEPTREQIQEWTEHDGTDKNLPF